MKISLIVAMASNRAIGLNGQMPWHLSADLKRFKKITMGAPVLMGRKTFEAIGRPLPGRKNVIVSRDPEYRQADCQTCSSIESALRLCAEWPEVFVIGGATLYEEMLADADYLYLTQIHKHFDGDTFFPEIDLEQWREIARDDVDNDQSVDFFYSFITLENRLNRN